MQNDQNPDTREERNSSSAPSELAALNAIVSALTPLSESARKKLLKTVAMFFEISDVESQEPAARPFAAPYNSSEPKDRSQTSIVQSTFSENRAPSPKQFVLEKKPQTDVDRIACLAYYLTHYREQPTFKTLELSKLNTEAAQIKFTNAARAVDNASAAHFLMQAGQGKKQISAIGELYVQALPDRAAARKAAAEVRTRRPKSRAKGSKTMPASSGSLQQDGSDEEEN